MCSRRNRGRSLWLPCPRTPLLLCRHFKAVLRHGYQPGKRNLQGVGDAHQVTQTHVSFSALDIAHVSPVQSDGMCKGFLTVTTLAAEVPYYLPQICLQLPVIHDNSRTLM